MRIGIITDGHSNPWGIESVIKYLRNEAIDEENTYNLGDITGMFPDVIPAVEMARKECGISLLGNHDAVVLNYFEDQPERWERVAAAEQNRRTLKTKRPDLLAWLAFLPLEGQLEENVYMVHNNPFGEKNKLNRDYMLARFGPVMKDPQEEKYNPKASKLIEASNGPHIILRGHAHAPEIHKIIRGLRKPRKGSIEKIRIPKEKSSFTFEIESNFSYIVTCGSACGASTMFTPDSELDYRPAGTILDYDLKKGTGKIGFFKIGGDYDPEKFINSVKSHLQWNAFEEAQKQIKSLSECLRTK